jgi:hypothetical protein
MGMPGAHSALINFGAPSLPSNEPLDTAQQAQLSSSTAPQLQPQRDSQQAAATSEESARPPDSSSTQPISVQQHQDIQAYSPSEVPAHLLLDRAHRYLPQAFQGAAAFQSKTEPRPCPPPHLLAAAEDFDALVHSAEPTARGAYEHSPPLQTVAYEADGHVPLRNHTAKPSDSEDSKVPNAALFQHTLHEHKEGADASHNQWIMNEGCAVLEGNGRQWRWCHAPAENAYTAPLESCAQQWHLHSLDNWLQLQSASGHADENSRSLIRDGHSNGICSVPSSGGSLSAGEQEDREVVVSSTLSERAKVAYNLSEQARVSSTLSERAKVSSTVVQNVCEPRIKQHVDASGATSKCHMSLTSSKGAAESSTSSEQAEVSSTMVQNISAARTEHVEAAAAAPCTGMWGQDVPVEALAGLFRSVADTLLATLQHDGVADGATLAIIRVADGERPGVSFLKCSTVYALKVRFILLSLWSFLCTHRL